MEKFHTHAGPKSVDDILSEILKRPKAEEREVVKARAVFPGEVSAHETVKLGPVDYEVLKASEPDWKQEAGGNFANVATGPVGPHDSSPYLVPPGANGPAGPATATGMTGFSTYATDGVAMVRDRAEVDLRKAIRRCHKEGVPVERMVEIFRLELVDIVHDD